MLCVTPASGGHPPPTKLLTVDFVYTAAELIQEFESIYVGSYSTFNLARYSYSLPPPILWCRYNRIDTDLHFPSPRERFQTEYGSICVIPKSPRLSGCKAKERKILVPPSSPRESFTCSIVIEGKPVVGGCRRRAPIFQRISKGHLKCNPSPTTRSDPTRAESSESLSFRLFMLIGVSSSFFLSSGKWKISA